MRRALAFGLVAAQFCFAFGSFFNYGYDYISYLPSAITAVFSFYILLFIGLTTEKRADVVASFLSRWSILFSLLFVLTCGLAFWYLRTRIHLFPGDECVGSIPQGKYTIDLPTRLDSFVLGTISWFAMRWTDLKQIDVLPSMYGMQVSSVVCGVLMSIVSVLFLRKKPLLLLAFLTMPWLINFFGNIDSYSFSVCYAVFFACMVGTILARVPRFWEVVLLVVLWGIGIWTDPFHVFFVFLITYVGCMWLKQWWSRFPTKTMLFLAGVCLFVVLKLSKYSNNLFDTTSTFVPAFFSWQTFIHYSNNLLLPLLPFALFIFMSKRAGWARGFLLVSWIMASLCFFTLAFTLGACDLFNYMQLLCILAGYALVVCMVTPLANKDYLLLILIHLFLLVPMVGVHSSSLTIKRAMQVYPKDKCHHNMVMSWQTHLGILCGENLQKDPAIEKATMDIFMDGANNAPEKYRIGNYIYYVAWNYHYGRFDEGRARLKDLLSKYPMVIRVLLSEKPGFILRNREVLLDDLVVFYPAANQQERDQVKAMVDSVKDKIRKNPYEAR